MNDVDQIILRVGSSTVKESEDELAERTPKTYRRDRRLVDPKQSIKLAERQGERQSENLEVGGSNPSQRANLLGTRTPPEKKIKRFQLRWREPLGKKECPYAYRWTLNLWLFSFRLHQWIRSDDKRFMHDHPWHFVTLVLKGGYVDVSERGRDTLRLGSVRFRHATHRHYVEVGKGGAWTLLLTSNIVRHWGFWVKGVFKRPLRYFGKFGHPPCNEQ